MTKKLRLLVTAACPRNCAGCCNKQWDLNALPICTDLSDYDEILLTGGEPMLAPSALLDLIIGLRRHTSASIYVYTADVTNRWAALAILLASDGLTLTIHEQADVGAFSHFTDLLEVLDAGRDKSLRLNLFKGISIPGGDYLWKWNVKFDVEWIEDCPLPKDEVFMRL